MEIGVQHRAGPDAQARVPGIQKGIQDAPGRGHLCAGPHSPVGGHVEFPPQADRIFAASCSRASDRQGLFGILGLPDFPEHPVRQTRQLSIPHTRTVSTDSYK